jgi:hypothetical protein
MTRRPLVLAVAAALVIAGCGGSAARADPGPALGVVDSACAPDRVAALREAGVGFAVVEAHWDRFEPAAGVPDPGYATALRDKVTACLDGGLRVVLGTGTQYPPSWVRALPGATFRDQRGAAPVTPGVDAVFSAAVRQAQADYLRALVAAVPADRLDGVRVGTSAAGELGYPGPSDAGDGFPQSWWAFGAAPQTGAGLAPGAAVTPLPGWVPGTRSVTPTDAGRWLDWYTSALLGAVSGQVDALRSAGYGGPVHVPAAGRGVLPADREAALAALLDGTADRDGSLGRGLSYPDQFAALAGIPGVVLDLTSVDDATAVVARSVGTDDCAAGDATAEPAPTWSNLRVARSFAARAGLPVVGENPGPPADVTGGTASSDPEVEQLRRGPGYARTCGLAVFFAAFEDDLFTGRSGASLTDLVPLP